MQSQTTYENDYSSTEKLIVDTHIYYPKNSASQ